MKAAGTILAFVLAVLLSQQALAQNKPAALPWELESVRCGHGDLILNERLMCSDRDVREASITLWTAYKEKAKELDAAQIDALRADHGVWFLSTCMGDRAGRYPLTADVARACLLRELPKREQFVRNLPTDRPTVPYILTRFERAMLQRFFGSTMALLNAPNNALQGGLMRVFGAILPDKLEQSFDPTGSPTFYFMRIGYVVPELESGRYFDAWGAQPRNGGFQGVFVVDMETGETTLAFIDASTPSFSAWEKACISSSFRDKSRALILKATARGSFHPINAASEIAGKFSSTPCN